MSTSPCYEKEIAELKARAEGLGNDGVEAFQTAQDDLKEYWGLEVTILDDLAKRLNEIENTASLHVTPVTFTHGS
jgi:hypothetical protein